MTVGLIFEYYAVDYCNHLYVYSTEILEIQKRYHVIVLKQKLSVTEIIKKYLRVR